MKTRSEVESTTSTDDTSNEAEIASTRIPQLKLSREIITAFRARTSLRAGGGGGCQAATGCASTHD